MKSIRVVLVTTMALLVASSGFAHIVYFEPQEKAAKPWQSLASDDYSFENPGVLDNLSDSKAIFGWLDNGTPDTESGKITPARYGGGAAAGSPAPPAGEAITPMMRYDPDQPPNPEDWLALAESERIRLIERYHRPAGVIRLSERGHARFHAVIENPLALADPAAAPRALQRLQEEGLTRHEALHALGAVLARHIGNVLPPGGEAGDAWGQYVADLKGLSADLWRQRFAEGEEG